MVEMRSLAWVGFAAAVCGCTQVSTNVTVQESRGGAGASLLLDSVLAAGGRASLVRVSTNSSIQTPLTTDGAALHQALDSLHISHGWTSLWDGIRLGNQTLGGDDTGAVVDVGDVHQF